MIFRVVLLFCVVPASLVICSAQSPEDRAFGWSVRVDPAAKKKRDRVKSTAPLPAPAIEEGEIRIESSLVLSDVLVQDRDGNAVNGLTTADFEIAEDGRRQNIDLFAHGSSAIPRSIFLVIDHSLSQWRYIDKTIAAAKTLVDGMRPTDRMAIVSDDISLIADLTGDKEVLRQTLERLRSKCHGGRFGQSRQYSALFAVLNEKIARNGARNIVILQTDGDELATLGTDISPFTFDQISAVAKRKGVTIYSVYTGARLADKDKKGKIAIAKAIMEDEAKAFHILQNKQPSFKRVVPSNEYLLSRADRLQIEEKAVADVAIRSGGISQFLEHEDQAAAIYDRILADIGHRYLIGYYLPDERGTNSKEREVKISLRTKGNYRVVGGRTFVTY